MPGEVQSVDRKNEERRDYYPGSSNTHRLGISKWAARKRLRGTSEELAKTQRV